MCVCGVFTYEGKACEQIEAYVRKMTLWQVDDTYRSDLKSSVVIGSFFCMTPILFTNIQSI